MEGSSYCCKVTAINVGSGDSILVELHSKGNIDYYLIDGGPRGYLSNVEKCLKHYNLIKEDTTLLCNVIVTHPDQDHVTGITELMKRYHIAGSIIITMAFMTKLWSPGHHKFLEEFFSVLCQQTHSLFLQQTMVSWQTSMISCQSPTNMCLEYTPPSATCVISIDHYGIDDLPCSAGWEQLVWNRSSILTTVYNHSFCGYAAVLTGDSFGDIVLRALKLIQDHKRERVQIFQVPHHGSKMNIEYGKVGTVSSCKKLYSSFVADVYLISGSDKIHPHAEILSGILSVVYSRYNKEFEEVSGKIVLTSSCGLSAEKIVKSVDTRISREYQIFLQRAMKIIHVDDIGIYCEHKAESQPFVSIMAGPDDCKILGGIPWTPETYHMEREKIICACKEYNLDVFGWTTLIGRYDTDDIDIFYGMHLLKVPFHEEPWQSVGDHREQQYVYIVRTTLDFSNYRQVLYLKEVKSAHNKLYEMFVYSDLSWTRKYVPRVFQLRESTNKYPINYYDERLDAYVNQLYPTQ